MFWLYQDSSRGGHEFHGTASDEHWDFPLAKWKLYLLLLFMMWFWAVSHQLRWDNDPPDAPVRLKCEEQTFVFVYFTILKIICSSLRQYREPLVTLHPFFFSPAVAKWRPRQKDVFRKHCWDYECNISSPAVWTSPEGVTSLFPSRLELN